MSNLLPLDTWRALMGFHPLHFWQLASSTVAPINTGCDDLVYQETWQNADAASRSEVAQAIEQAEALVRRELGYSVAPRYATWTLPWPRVGSPADADGRRLTVQLPEGYIQASGTEKLTSIAAPAVVYTDPDGDGYKELFTVSFTTTVTDASQLALYVPAAERLESTAIDDRWRILPIKASISAGTATITGRAWLLTRPILTSVLSPSAIDPTDTTRFLSTVEAYQRTTETNGTTVSTSQGVITWETSPSHGWWCCCTGCSTSTAYGGSPYDPAAVAQAVARVGLRDGMHGIAFAAEASYDSSSGIWSALDWAVCAVPDRLLVRALAGLALDSDGQMAAHWRPVIARLAAAELARPICGCESANRELYRWQFDLARTAGANDEAYGAISAEDLNNPLGTRRGHVQAWRAIRSYKQLRGFLP